MKMLTCAHHGTTSGEPMYAIWPQSKVSPDMPRPDTTPKSWLTTTLLGAIQQTQLKTDRAVNR